MKYSSNDYPKIYDGLNLVKAWDATKKGRSNNKAILKYGKNIDDHLSEIQTKLRNETYNPGNYHSFIIYEPKRRVIQSMEIENRLVQHALYDYVYEIFERVMINTSYACMKNRGSQLGMLKFHEYVRKVGKGGWIIKCDIHHFFNSIDKNVLSQFLRKIIRDGKICRLLLKFIPMDIPGIPIGNLLSQLFANFYMSKLDHYIKDQLGIRYYVRYMDDFAFVVKSKSKAKELLQLVTNYVTNVLKLKLNSKTKIFPSYQGANFLGYLIYWDHTKIRHSTVHRVKSKINKYAKIVNPSDKMKEKIRASVMSWFAISKFGNCFTIIRKIILLANKLSIDLHTKRKNSLMNLLLKDIELGRLVIDG
jgi:hypothetical protein